MKVRDIKVVKKYTQYLSREFIRKSKCPFDQYTNDSDVYTIFRPPYLCVLWRTGLRHRVVSSLFISYYIAIFDFIRIRINLFIA